MKLILLIASLITFSSCSEFTKMSTENKPVQLITTKKLSTSKKIAEAKKLNSKNEISGTLSSGTIYEATPDEEGFVISFDPFIARKDEIFIGVINQVITKLYNDTIKDESHISIETDIGYTIFKGQKARYKIVPYKENSGEISSLSINSI